MNAMMPWKRALHRKSLWFSLLVMVVLGSLAVLAPWIAPHDPYRQAIAQHGLPPS